MNASNGDVSLLNWPEPCQCSMYRPALRLHDMPTDMKAVVWSDLKSNNSTKANGLKTMALDNIIKQLIAELGASLAINKDHLSIDIYEKVERYFE